MNSDSKRVEQTSKDDSHHYHWNDGQPIGTTVVLAVATKVGCEPTDLPALSTVVDPDGLDQLLTESSDSVTVSFRYAGCTVSLMGDRTLTVS